MSRANTSASDDRVAFGSIQSPDRQFLSFLVGSQEFATPILSVIEVIRFTPPTIIPHAPSFVRGVLNIRGQVVPVMDLAERFGLEAVEEVSTACVIVTDFEGSNGATRIGIVVERVERVVDLEEGEELQAPPSFGVPVEAKYLMGMFSAGDRMIPVIDLIGILSALELGQVEETAREANEPGAADADADGE